MQITDKVREYLVGAKGAKRQIAEFFLTSFDEIPVLTLDEISRRTGVSASTVSRVASEIGFSGFPDFQRKAWDFHKAGLSPSDRMDAAMVLAEQTAQESLRQDIQNLAQITQLNATAVFDEAAAEIAKADDVHVLGVRTASTLSSFFFYALSKIRSRVYNWGADGFGATEHYLEITRGSLLFVASFPRYSEITINAAREVCRRGGRVISLTDGPSSPLVPYSHVSLYAPYESISYFNSMIAPLSVINLLVVKTNTLLGKKGKEHLMQYEDLLNSSVAVVRKTKTSADTE